MDKRFVSVLTVHFPTVHCPTVWGISGDNSFLGSLWELPFIKADCNKSLPNIFGILSIFYYQILSQRYELQRYELQRYTDQLYTDG